MLLLQSSLLGNSFDPLVSCGMSPSRGAGPVSLACFLSPDATGRRLGHCSVLVVVRRQRHVAHDINVL